MRPVPPSGPFRNSPSAVFRVSAPPWPSPGGAPHRFLVAIAGGKHPFPSRTRSLRPPAPRVLLLLRSGRAGRRQDTIQQALCLVAGGLLSWWVAEKAVGR